MRSLQLVICVVAMAAAASGATVTFDTMTGNSGDPFTGIAENGLTVTPGDPSWLKAFEGGNPFIVWTTPLTRLNVTMGGGLFLFTSVDLAAFSQVFADPIGYSINGLLGGSVVFILVGSLPINSTWVTISSGSAMDVSVDTLSINLRFSGQNPTLRGLDNIVVADVPEPGSLSILTAGLAAILLRRRQRARTKA